MGVMEVTRGASVCQDDGAWPWGRATEDRAGKASEERPGPAPGPARMGERPGTIRPDVALRDWAVEDLSFRTRRPEEMFVPREAARLAELGAALVAEA